MYRHNQQQGSTSKYNIRFFNTTIETTVTNDSTTVTTWLQEITACRRRSPTPVGLDVEWRPQTVSYVTNKAATLQLCIDQKCIIIQLSYLHQIPQSLRNFLLNPNFTFVGIEVGDDLAKLRDDYGLLHSGNLVDIRSAAKDRWPGRFGRPGLKDLAYEVCGMVMSKPIHVTMSNWDAEVLSVEQVEYACIDAFASYKIGYKVLVEK